MKKYLSIILALTLVMTLIAAGCGGSSSPSTTKAPPTPAKSYTMATGGTSGTFFPFGGALCQIVNKANGTNITVNSTGGGKENMALLASKDVDFALLDADMMSYALTGTETYKDKKITTFGSIASLFPQVVQIVVAANSDIKSIADLKGKSVSVGDPGSGSAVNAAQILGAYGMTFKDFKVHYLSLKESAAAFQDNSIDAFIAVAGMPTTAVTEANLNKKIHMLPIDQEHMKILTTKYSFFAPVVVGKNVYGATSDTSTLAVKATVVALKSVSDEVVYNFTKAMFENLDNLAAAHAKGKEMSLKQAIEGIDTAYLHPGAAKYYKEKGMLK